MEGNRKRKYKAKLKKQKKDEKESELFQVVHDLQSLENLDSEDDSTINSNSLSNRVFFFIKCIDKIYII